MKVASERENQLRSSSRRDQRLSAEVICNVVAASDRSASSCGVATGPIVADARSHWLASWRCHKRSGKRKMIADLTRSLSARLGWADVLRSRSRRLVHRCGNSALHPHNTPAHNHHAQVRNVRLDSSNLSLQLYLIRFVLDLLHNNASV